MTHTELSDKVTKVFAIQFTIDKNAICTHLKFEKIDESYDELDGIEILMGIEDEFGLSIDDKIADKWKTIDDMIDYVATQIEIHGEISRFELIDFEV